MKNKKCKSITSSIALGPCKITDNRTNVDKLIKACVKVNTITYFADRVCFSDGYPDYVVKGFPNIEIIIE